MTVKYTVPGLSTDQVDDIIEVLQQRLSAYNDLHLTLKHVHWNVVGPHFIAVHEMIDPQVELVRGFADDVAERIATLGGSPKGTPGAVVAVAVRAGARGVMLDTADKGGPGLLRLFEPAALAAWVREGHAAGLFVALAGRLAADDVGAVRDAGADVVGVRGAACVGGRAGGAGEGEAGTWTSLYCY